MRPTIDNIIRLDTGEPEDGSDDPTDNHGDDSTQYDENRREAAKADFIYQFNTRYSRPTYDVLKSDIGGLEKILDRLEAFQRGIEHSNLYEFMGVNPPNGFLLNGPAGTGKTYIAKYLAQSLNARFVDLPLNEFESKWVGEAEKALSGHIKNMRSYHRATGQKVLLFFDEAEEAFKDRSLPGWHAPRVNVLLREMDGLGDNRGIIFGGATNYLDRVDPALRRAGRFDFIIEMPKYDVGMITQVYVAIASKLNRRAPHHDPYQITDVAARELAEISHRKGHVPADIQEIYRLAAEEKIKTMVSTNRKMYSHEDYIVTGGDLLAILRDYKRFAEAKPQIGFNGN